jgi:hypothetical protein
MKRRVPFGLKKMKHIFCGLFKVSIGGKGRERKFLWKEIYF